MAVSEEQIQALTEMISLWRMQEYIFITFYCFYVYYVLTTTHEEVSLILPQKWSRGKALYILTRYPVILSITLSLIKDYRTFFSITPDVCKGMSVTFIVVLKFVAIACDYSLGLCLGALLHAGPLVLIAILTLSCGLPIANSVLYIIALVQYPAERTSNLDRTLGYPCYAISSETTPEGWVGGHTGQDVRSYLSLAITILLALLGGLTLFVRFKGQGMGLVHVIRRDGGIHYLSLIAIRLSAAITVAPALNLAGKLYTSPITIASQVLIPILTQRLLINMRKVDYMGSQPVASKLLFAAPAPGDSEDDDVDDSDAFLDRGLGLGFGRDLEDSLGLSRDIEGSVGDVDRERSVSSYEVSPSPSESAVRTRSREPEMGK